MDPFERPQEDTEQKGSRDHAEQYPTENESLFDKYISQRTVDSIPVEDQKMERHEEEERDGKEKDRSSSENKYKP